MNAPAYAFLSLPDEASYRQRYIELYCRRPVFTRHGIRVVFKPRHFDHAFFESSDWNGAKDIFSLQRAQRLEWIRIGLLDSNSEWRKGYNKKSHSYSDTRSVCIIAGDFVVIIRITGRNRAEFVTCFWADNSINKIRMSPRWYPSV